MLSSERPKEKESAFLWRKMCSGLHAVGGPGPVAHFLFQKSVRRRPLDEKAP